MDFKLLFFLTAVSALPLGLLLKFSPYEMPQIQFFFLGILFVLRIVFFREDEYKKNIKPQAKQTLQKKIGRVPSDPEVIDFVDKNVAGRNVAFFVAIVLTLIVSIFA